MNVGKYLRGEDRHVGTARVIAKADTSDEDLMLMVIKESRRLNKLIEKHREQLKNVLAQCNHLGHVVEKSSYYEGSYLDKAYTRMWNECTVCGQKSEDYIKQHNYYG